MNLLSCSVGSSGEDQDLHSWGFPWGSDKGGGYPWCAHEVSDGISNSGWSMNSPWFVDRAIEGANDITGIVVQKSISNEWTETDLIESFACQFWVETHIRLEIGSSLSWFLEWNEWINIYLNLVQGAVLPGRVSLLISLPGLEKRRDQVGGLLSGLLAFVRLTVRLWPCVSLQGQGQFFQCFFEHLIFNTYGLAQTTP